MVHCISSSYSLLREQCTHAALLTALWKGAGSVWIYFCSSECALFIPLSCSRGKHIEVQHDTTVICPVLLMEHLKVGVEFPCRAWEDSVNILRLESETGLRAYFLSVWLVIN